MVTLQILLNIGIFLLMSGVLVYQQKHKMAFNRRVVTALILGLSFGAVLQLIYGPGGEVTSATITWLNIVGQGYIRLLQMIVVPLVFLAITSAIVNLKDVKTLGKYGANIIIILLITTTFAAAIGMTVATVFNLDASTIDIGMREETRMDFMETRGQEINASTIVGRIIDIIPTNVFAAFSGTGSSPTLNVVFFAIFAGVATLTLKQKPDKEKEAGVFVSAINSLQAVIMGIIQIIIAITPYGVLALMTRFLATSNFADIRILGIFVIAVYLTMLLVLVMHGVVLVFHGLNPITHFKKCFTALSFAFASRSSAATLPLTIKTQEQKLGVPKAIASLSSTFGTSIGQNG